MTFADIAAGTEVFLDVNTLVYYFKGDPLYRPPCDQLLNRIETGDVTGFTSAQALSNLCHRLMTIEAHTRFGWPLAGITRRLRRNPGEVQKLSHHRQAVDELAVAGVQLLPVFGPTVSRAVDESRALGLLSEDALIVCVMRENRLAHLASNDADFDRVPGVTRYAPV